MTARVPETSMVWMLLGMFLFNCTTLVIEAVGQQDTGSSGLPGRLLLFPPPVSDYETESTPYCMDLSTGVLSPMPVAEPQLPEWHLPVVYDERTNAVHFIVNGGQALGRLDLSVQNPKCQVTEPFGHDSDLVGISPALKRHTERTTLSNLYSEDSFVIGNAVDPSGRPVAIYAPAIHGEFFYLAYASKDRAVYSIITSWHKFRITQVLFPDSIATVDSTTYVDRVILRLIRVDSTGHITLSKDLKPVVYIGMDISADGQWCALPEPLDRDSRQIDFVLLNLLTDSIVSPALGDEYSFSGPVFSPDGRWLAVHGRSRLNSRRGVFISQTPRFDRFELLHEYLEGDVCALTWSPDSEYLMIGVESSLTANIFQGLEAIHVPTRSRRQVPAPRITQPEEAVLLSKFQQYAWVR